MAKSQELIPVLKPLKRVGIIDSGIGGLSILKPLLESLPAEYFYLADTKNFPYGAKSAEELVSISYSNIKLLDSYGIKTIILACHTLSAIVLDELKKEFPHITFFDVIQPVIQKSLAVTKNKKIGVLATVATVNSHFYKKTFASFDNNIQTFEYASSNLATLIETCDIQDQKIHDELKNYVKNFLDDLIDTLILGCTHYEWIKEIIEKNSSSTLVCASKELILSIKRNYTSNLNQEAFAHCLVTKKNSLIEYRFNQLFLQKNIKFSHKVLNQISFSSNV